MFILAVNKVNIFAIIQIQKCQIFDSLQKYVIIIHDGGSHPKNTPKQNLLSTDLN